MDDGPNGDRPAAEAKTVTPQQAWVGAVCNVTGWNVGLMAGRAGKLVKALRAAGGTVAELLEHYGQEDVGSVWWFYRDDWRGKRGQRPDDGAIRATWGLWDKPIVVAVPQSAAGALLEYARSLGHGND